MGANIAAFSHVQSSFNFGKRKRPTRVGMYDKISKELKSISCYV